MTEVFLDGQRIEFEDRDKSATLGELIEAMNRELKSMKRFIVEVSVDGESMIDWAGSSSLRDSIYAHSDLRLFSDAVESMALKGLHTVEEYILLIKAEAALCLTDIRTGAGSAGARLNAVFEGMIEVIKNMEALSIGAGKYAITVFREDPSPYLKRALETLEAIGKARAAGDAVTLTDALEYEAIPLLEEMGRALFVSGGSNPC